MCKSAREYVAELVCRFQIIHVNKVWQCNFRALVSPYRVPTTEASCIRWIWWTNKLDRASKFFESPSNVDVDSDLAEFHPEVPIEEAASNRFDANQHVASAYASIVGPSFCRGEGSISRIKLIEASTLKRRRSNANKRDTRRYELIQCEISDFKSDRARVIEWEIAYGDFSG